MEAQLAEGTILENRYKIIRRIGHGGMGVVYTATHLQLERVVAIKVLHPAEADNEGMIKRFKIEAKSAASIHHPHIVEVMDFGITPDNRPFFVMEYLVGESLADKLERELKLSEREMVDITEQILIGLSVAHKSGIVHRDLKPENIFLNRVEGKQDVVKILDFGISKIVAGRPSIAPSAVAATQHKLTQVGMVLGTPGYMAPESLFGDTDIDARADLFSVGVLMFEMLAGRLPFRGSDPHKIMISTASKPVPNLLHIRPDISKAMNRLVLTSLAKNPGDRFQTASELLEYLRAAAVGRIIHNARPCKTRIGVPSIMPSTASPNQMVPKTVEKPEPPREAPYRREDPSQPKAPPNRRSAQSSYAVGDVHSVPPEPTPKKKSLHPVPLKRRRFSVWISPFYLLIIAGLGVGGYYLYTRDRLSVTTDSVVDPIDERIESLNNQPIGGNEEVDERAVEEKPLRDDGTPVPTSVIIWIETPLEKFEVTKGDRILVERPLVLTGDTKPVELTFSARGYEKKVFEVVPDREQTLKVKLKKKR